MNAAFADTYYYLALLNESDAGHRPAVDLARNRSGRTITTAWVLAEVADALASPESRSLFLALYKNLRENPRVTIVPPTVDLFEKGVTLYANRSDKEWSLTDCISFVIMDQYRLTDALTADHHFEQAGFFAMLA